MEAMQIDECLRTLMLGPAATSEEIRQAYLDMVRVWHPDRFQSDPRLRQVAEERLRAINQAYMVLRGPVSARAAAEEAPPPPEPTPAQRATPPRTKVYRAPRWIRLRLRPRFRVPRTPTAKIAHVCAAAALCLAPLAAASWWSRIWRAPLPLPDAAAAVAGSIVPSLPDLTSIDLPQTRPETAASADPPLPRDRPARREQRPAATVDLKALQSGAELLEIGGRRGAGELHIVNGTPFDMVAGLLRGKEMVREMYVAPGAAASMAHIAVGVYRVLLEAGSELDSRTLRFHRVSVAPEISAPLEFLEFSTSSGTSGQHYELILRPGSVSP
jgi:hypothetical protein